ncbi:hypothetical protein EMPS_10950 [Entomortierella parvispora]|uniref:Ubinuclein middle domain-containing protein n=1 Tax=Entomortierella parvispora TaxID=205924 RepID=A0A9P3HL37_9FUNG|nr:hypothetical protein EMPS_10950 [Entomortierella parvispora]
MTPFSSPPSDLMASAMGGAGFLANAAIATSNTTSSTDSPSSKAKRAKKGAAVPNGAVRIFYSLKENPHAIISYADLVRQEQENRQRQSSQLLVPSKTGGTTSPINPSSSSSPSIKQSATGAAVIGQGNGSAVTDSKDGTAMDVDQPEGEEDESEAEEEDDGAEDDEDEDDAEVEGEAEDEDDDDDPEEEDDEEEDSETRPREPKDFLEALTEKYANMDENGNEGEDEDEDEEGVRSKRPSRWDSEHYDIEDEFIDDSEMMLEAIGMIRPKIEGFFAFRGPVETVEDNDSSDAGQRQKKIVRRRAPASASPSSTGRGSGTKAVKASSLAIVENANDTASEASEPEEKSKPSKGAVSNAPTAESTTSSEIPTGTASEAGPNSTAATPTKKKAPASKAKAIVKEPKDSNKDATKDAPKAAIKDAETNRDSDKETKPAPKKPRAKSTKTSLASSTNADVEPTNPSSTAALAPSVRIDSPPPADENTEMSTPPPSSPSPSKPKPKKSTAKASGSELASASTAAVQDSGMESSSSTTTKTAAKPKAAAVGDGQNPKGKGTKALEPLQKDVQALYNVVAELARKETWAVKTKFPLHIKAPLFECAKLALATGTGYVLDENFLAHLQVVLPYNKFTLKKLIYKNILPSWITTLENQRVHLLDQFKKRVGMLSKSAGLVDRPFPTEKDNDDDVEMTEGEDRRKFPWSQDLRLLLWESMEKFMELLAVKQEFFSIDENQPPPSTESKTRKDAYQVLVQAFPHGWMTSYEISRQYSQLKEKVQKQTGREIDPSTSKIKPILTSSKYSSARASNGVPVARSPALPNVSRPIDSASATTTATATLTATAPSTSALSPSKSPRIQPALSPAPNPPQPAAASLATPLTSDATGSTATATITPASVPSRKRKKAATEAEPQLVLSSGEDTPMPMAIDSEEPVNIPSEKPAISSGGLSPSLSAADLAVYHSLIANSKKKKADSAGVASANKVPRSRKVMTQTTKTVKQKEPDNSGQEAQQRSVGASPTTTLLQPSPSSGAPSRGRKVNSTAPLTSSQGYSPQSHPLQRPPSPPPPSLYHSPPTHSTLPPIHGSPYFQQHSPSPPAHRRVTSPGSSGHPMGGAYVASAVSPPRGSHPHMTMNQALNRQQQQHGYSQQQHRARPQPPQQQQQQQQQYRP